MEEALGHGEETGGGGFHFDEGGVQGGGVGRIAGEGLEEAAKGAEAAEGITKIVGDDAEDFVALAKEGAELGVEVVEFGPAGAFGGGDGLGLFEFVAESDGAEAAFALFRVQGCGEGGGLVFPVPSVGKILGFGGEAGPLAEGANVFVLAMGGFGGADGGLCEGEEGSVGGRVGFTEEGDGNGVREGRAEVVAFDPFEEGVEEFAAGARQIVLGAEVVRVEEGGAEGGLVGGAGGEFGPDEVDEDFDFAVSELLEEGLDSLERVFGLGRLPLAEIGVSEVDEGGGGFGGAVLGLFQAEAFFVAGDGFFDPAEAEKGDAVAVVKVGLLEGVAAEGEDAGEAFFAVGEGEFVVAEVAMDQREVAEDADVGGDVVVFVGEATAAGEGVEGVIGTADTVEGDGEVVEAPGLRFPESSGGEGEKGFVEAAEGGLGRAASDGESGEGEEGKALEVGASGLGGEASGFAGGGFGGGGVAVVERAFPGDEEEKGLGGGFPARAGERLEVFPGGGAFGDASDRTQEAGGEQRGVGREGIGWRRLPKVVAKSGFELAKGHGCLRAGKAFEVGENGGSRRGRIGGDRGGHRVLGVSAIRSVLQSAKIGERRGGRGARA